MSSDSFRAGLASEKEAVWGAEKGVSEEEEELVDHSLLQVNA